MQSYHASVADTVRIEDGLRLHRLENEELYSLGWESPLDRRTVSSTRAFSAVESFKNFDARFSGHFSLRALTLVTYFLPIWLQCVNRISGKIYIM